MSIPVRHSGRIAFAALIVITLIAALLGVRLFAVADVPPETIGIDRPTQPRIGIDDPAFKIGPIEGLTTTWHWAPRATSIPLGTIAELFQPAPSDATVIWTGAAEVARDDQGSTAVCPLVLPGFTMVQVEVIPADGGEAISSRTRFNVVDIDVEQITVSPIDMWVDPVEIDADLPEDEINEQTMSYFFGPESIAALRDLGHGQYRTSVDRKVHMSVNVDPPGFAPLIEWRFGAEATRLGAATTRVFREIGTHLVDVGPLLNPAQSELETYSVTITSHTSGQDTVPDGWPILFIAETDPPGYEQEITWLSSTKYGMAQPVLGSGATFTVQFENTFWVDIVDEDVQQWLGVKADNGAFGQDQKVQTVCLGGGGDTQYADPITPRAHLVSWAENTMGGIWSASGYANAQEMITEICGAFADNNNTEICAFLTGHGAAGEWLVGGDPDDETTWNDCDPDTDPNCTASDITCISNNNVDWLGDQLNGKVCCLTIWGCSVGANQPFVNTLAANGRMCVVSWDDIVCFSNNIFCQITSYSPSVNANCTKKGECANCQCPGNQGCDCP